MFDKNLDVPKIFEKIKAKADIVELKIVLFILFIKIPTLKQLESVLDFKSENVRLEYSERNAAIFNVSRYSEPRLLGNKIYSKKSGMDSYNCKTIEIKKENNEELVLAVCCDELCKQDNDYCLTTTIQTKRV